MKFLSVSVLLIFIWTLSSEYVNISFIHQQKLIFNCWFNNSVKWNTMNQAVNDEECVITRWLLVDINQLKLINFLFRTICWNSKVIFHRELLETFTVCRLPYEQRLMHCFQWKLFTCWFCIIVDSDTNI